MARAEQSWIVAEAGVNHNGSLELAKNLIAEAVTAKANAIKFQMFRADKLVTRTAPLATYQAKNLSAKTTQHALLKQFEFSPEQFRLLANYADCEGIEFIATPFDTDSATFLVEELGVSRLKIGSGDLTNGPLLLDIARLGKPIVLSTGMGTLAEVEQALAVIAFGFVSQPDAKVSPEGFSEAFASTEGKDAVRSKVTLLHCTTDYPTSVTDVNLRAMDTLREFGCPVGLSDHTTGTSVAIAAVARGAALIEKHFTIDRTMAGPDHVASLEPGELAAMIAGIRDVEAALGSSLKAPTEGETRNIPAARKSLVALRRIKEGERFTAENLGVKRPGIGITPMAYWTMLGQTAQRAYAADDLIEP